MSGAAFVVPVALGGALGVAVGFVVQQHAAAEEPPQLRLSFRLLGHLVRRRLWLGGVVAMAVGQVLGAIALGHGSLALVEPIMAGNLLFALPLSAAWHRRRLGRREWLGAVALIAGLATFIAVGDPSGGSTRNLPWPNWALSAGGICTTAGLLVLIGRRLPAVRQATLLAAGAGVLYGLQDALTQRAIANLSHGIVALLVSWPAFMLLAVAIVAMLLAQSAFEAAPLPASLPASTVAEPVTAIVFGLAVYRVRLHLSPPDFAGEIVGFTVMVVGVILVASSPLLAGHMAEDVGPEGQVPTEPPPGHRLDPEGDPVPEGDPAPGARCRAGGDPAGSSQGDPAPGARCRAGGDPAGSSQGDPGDGSRDGSPPLPRRTRARGRP